MLEISSTRTPVATLIEVAGRVDGVSADELRAALQDALETGQAKLVVELAQVDYISSAGLRELFAALKQAQRAKGDIRLAAPSPRVADLLELSGLDTLFKIFPDREAALATF
jgi:anti-sigma B factor antagonist